MQKDELYMQRCIDLSKIGMGYVAPNPMVGAVIVLDDKIIGEGAHLKYGEAHAEVNAVNSVVDKELLCKATIYVSLEPCAHFGKTAPCADLLVASKFKRVVIGCRDSFSEVSGKGIQKLLDAGIEVVVGVLEDECRELNKRFFTFHEKKRPYIVLKWAQTLDGFVDKVRQKEEQKINWISAPETKVLVHTWRAQEQAILVGKITVLNDNPSLTVREVTGKNPIRIVLDSYLTLKQDNAIFNEEADTIVFNLSKSDEYCNCRWIKVEEMNVSTILSELHKLNVQSVIIEGGVQTIQSFIDAEMWDEARVIVGDSFFKEGLKAPVLAKIPSHSFSFFTDKIYHYSNL